MSDLYEDIRSNGYIELDGHKLYAVGTSPDRKVLVSPEYRDFGIEGLVDLTNRTCVAIGFRLECSTSPYGKNFPGKCSLRGTALFDEVMNNIKSTCTEDFSEEKISRDAWYDFISSPDLEVLPEKKLMDLSLATFDDKDVCAYYLGDVDSTFFFTEERARNYTRYTQMLRRLMQGEDPDAVERRKLYQCLKGKFVWVYFKGDPVPDQISIDRIHGGCASENKNLSIREWKKEDRSIYDIARIEYAKKTLYESAS